MPRGFTDACIWRPEILCRVRHQRDRCGTGIGGNTVLVNENLVQDIVQEVVAKMQIAESASGKHGIFTDMNEAIAAAKASQKTVRLTRGNRLSVISAGRPMKMRKSLPGWESTRQEWAMWGIRY